MIKVVYHRKDNRLTIEGHARSGEMGHDLVCSAASILAYTLAANVASMEEAGLLVDMSINMTPGDAEIMCNPNSSFKSTTTLTFDSICAGFNLLAHDYPDNISYEIEM